MADLGRVLTLRDRIEALPEHSATKSRDYGRGYAEAVRDVVGLLNKHDPTYLTEVCMCDSPDDENLPAHLRSDAPLAQCSACGRKSVSEFGMPCTMPQPDGSRCRGEFGAPNA